MVTYKKEAERENRKIVAQYDDDQIYLPTPPEESTPFGGISRMITYWGFSQQGESHITSNTPCQDRCKVVVSKTTKRTIIIAAIADGVGSCALSHYGAGIAVNTATSYLKKKFDTIIQYDSIEDGMVKKLLLEAMQNASEEVKKTAEEMEQLEYSFQSTLTIAVYDGRTLFYAHCGDDGLIVLTNDGQVKMATARMKGEEANSVYPLQAGQAHWQITRVEEDVQAFMLITDGVLDAFVGGEMENNRVYYPFFKPAFETKQTTESSVEEVLNFYYDYMKSKELRDIITDDLTMVLVSNQKYQNKHIFPVFDEKEWMEKTNEYKTRRNRILYPEDERTVSSDSDNELTPEFVYRETSSHEEIKRKMMRLKKKQKKIWHWITTYAMPLVISFLVGVLSGILLMILLF